MTTPTSIILAHVGAVLDFLLIAATKHRTHTEIAQAVAEVLMVMGERPENREVMAGSNAIAVGSGMLSDHPHSPPILRAAITALAQLVDEMVTMQKKSLVLILRKMMTTVDDGATLANCCALNQAIIESFKPQRRWREKQLMVNRDILTAHRDAMEQGKLAEGTPDPVTLDSLIPEDLEEMRTWADEEMSMKMFMGKEIVPFVALVLQHFGEEDLVVARAAEGCLRALTISKW